LLQAINISKSFDGVTVLEGIQLETFIGRVLALIGENGAGKSTLMKILSGVYTDYGGHLILNNKEVKFKSTKEAKENGVVIIHQELNLIQDMTIQENLFLGEEFVNKYGFLDQKGMDSKAKEILNKIKLDKSPQTKLSELRVGEQQLLEIAKAILADAKLIIMDEPTSALSQSEVLTLFEIIGELKNDGKSIIYISHKLDELYSIADDFTILRDGKLIASGKLGDISQEEIVSKMIGRDFDRGGSTTSKEMFKEVLLKVEGLTTSYSSSKISFDLNRGEILGIFGLMGAGRTELLQALFGLSERIVDIQIDGKDTTINCPADAIKHGLAYVTEDRKLEGIIPSFSVRENMSLVTLSTFIRNGFIQKNKEVEFAQSQVTAKQIKLSSIEQAINKLSGGNQQKVILAKWLASNPKVLLLDEPTRGIDVNAKSEMYKIIQELAVQGMSVIMVSSEMPEILALSHRILVLADGEISAQFSIEDATEERLLVAALGQNKLN
jgi:ribose transport system ATP-binding protein